MAGEPLGAEVAVMKEDGPEGKVVVIRKREVCGACAQLMVRVMESVERVP
jgi:hypothetical protein